MPFKIRQDWDKNHRSEENEQESLKQRWIVRDKKIVKMMDVWQPVRGLEPLAGGSGTLASAAATCNVSH